MISTDLTSHTGDNLEKVLYLFLGWLLGLLSPIVVDAIRRRRELKEIKNALIVDLQELQYRLALNVYLSSARTGQVSRSFLEWFTPIVESYRGLHQSDENVQRICKLLTLSDTQLASVTESMKGDPNEGEMLKKQQAPFLESRIGQLGLFSTQFQILLFDIHMRLGIVNEEVEQYRYYLRKTFSGDLSDRNYQLIRDNIQRSLKAVSDQARLICDLIDKAVKA